MDENEPLMKCRENVQSVKTTGLWLPEDLSVAGTCFTGYITDGIKEA